MATQKAALQEHEITVRLTDEEYELLQAFADENDIDDLSLAIPKAIRELVALSDRLWDSQLARSPELLKKMAQEALDEHRAGLTEDMP